MENAPEILGVGIIVVIAGGVTVVWYLRRKGYREAETKRRSRAELESKWK